MAKRMEVWEAAAALGVGTNVIERQGGQQQAASGNTIPESELAILRARVAYAEGRGPKPEPQASSSEEIAQMMNLMGP